ncbi:MAG: HEAT repeat domain-containing protein [Planctomycetota bacterium]|jgi:HEAT repeat protein
MRRTGLAWLLLAALAAGCGPVPGLIEDLRDESRYVREAAEAELLALGAEAVTDLIEAVEAADPVRRYDAAGILEELGPTAERAIPALIDALNDRWYADGVREQAARALGSVGRNSQAAIDALLTTLGERDDDFAGTAGIALARIGPNAIPGLIKALMDSSDRVSMHAYQALADIGSQAAPALLDLFESAEYPRPPGELISLLGKLGTEAKPAAPKIARLLESEAEAPGTRAAAAGALAKILGREAVPFLLQTLEDRSSEIRGDVLWVLGQMGQEAKAAFPALVAALRDKSKETAHAAFVALMRVGPVDDKDAMKALTKALTDEDGRVRKLAALAFARLAKDGTAAIPVLVEALVDTDRDGFVSGRAYDLLVWRVGRQAIPALTKALTDDDDYVREIAAAVLTKIKARAEAEKRDADDPTESPQNGF